MQKAATAEKATVAEKKEGKRFEAFGWERKFGHGVCWRFRSKALERIFCMFILFE